MGYHKQRSLPMRRGSVKQRKSSKGTRRARAPKAKKAPRAKKPKKERAPCKYGPRGPDGRCPKKPKQVKSIKDQAAHVIATAAQKGALAAGGAATRKLRQAYAANPEGTVEAAKQLGLAAFKVAGAAALGYAIGSAITSFTDYMAPDERKLRLANAYRAARADAAARLGRPLSAAEVSAMGETYKAAIAQIDKRSTPGKIAEWIRAHISTPH